MKTDIKEMELFAPKWWNPLFWLVVVLGPVVCMVAGGLFGALSGLLIGYERGLGTAGNMLRKLIAQLP